jgi:hypothetical protein
MAIYAVADKVPEGCKSITESKPYQVISEIGNVFLIRDDDGAIQPFMFDIQTVAVCGNWRRVEK